MAKVTPRSRLKSYGDRAFSVCAPRRWNTLSSEYKCSFNLISFKRSLKTYPFKHYFSE